MSCSLTCQLLRDVAKNLRLGEYKNLPRIFTTTQGRNHSSREYQLPQNFVIGSVIIPQVAMVVAGVMTSGGPCNCCTIVQKSRGF